MKLISNTLRANLDARKIFRCVMAVAVCLAIRLGMRGLALAYIPNQAKSEWVEVLTVVVSLTVALMIFFWSDDSEKGKEDAGDGKALQQAVDDKLESGGR